MEGKKLAESWSHIKNYTVYGEDSESQSEWISGL